MVQKMPHSDVYTRLFCSPIHGVGVAAIANIKKDTLIFRGDDADLIWISKKHLEKLPTEVRKLYDDFAVIRGDEYGCPTNFNLMTPAWYLNEPKPGDTPNVRANEDFEFFALRDIEKGDCTYSEKPARQRQSP